MSLAGQQNQFLPFLIALVVPFLLSAGAIVLKPVREFLEAWVGRDLDSTTCRIYFFGCRGSGKTAMIKNILASGEITTIASTSDFNYFEGTKRYDLKGDVQLRIQCADYTGEQPSMVTIDLPEGFAGPRGDRAINVVFFMVDIIPRVLDDSGRVLGDEGTVAWLQNNADEKIRNRLSEHHDYLSGPMLQVVFSSAYSPQLRSVRLVITKLDLVQEACTRGYLTCSGANTLLEWLRKNFASIEGNIREACQQNNISDFSVHVVSTTQDIGTRALLSELWKHHLRAIGVQVP
jgi:hypothetical protein